MQKKIFMILALLCAVAQGAWAQNYDVWDGVTKTKPQEILDESTNEKVIHIRTAAELAYIRDYFKDDDKMEWNEIVHTETEYGQQVYYYYYDFAYERPISLDADIDMGDAVSWIPLGRVTTPEVHYAGTFYGNGHTIRIHTSGATANYQGLFSGIASGARVENLHVVADINCSASRLVGGIAGENDGTIENCWVSGWVSSDWTNSSVYVTGKVGGIAGENNGTVQPLDLLLLSLHISHHRRNSSCLYLDLMD